MIYSDEENRTWWSRLAKQEQAELFERMVLRSSTDGARSFALGLRDWWVAGKSFSGKQLACLRKWEAR